MLIVCPSCSSQYELDAAKLGPEGRKVRCSQCRTLWHVDLAAEREAQEKQAFETAPSSDETRALLDAELAYAELNNATPSNDEMSDPPPAAEVDAAPTTLPKKKRTSKARPAKRAAGPKFAGAGLPLALAIGGLAILGLLTVKRNAVVKAAPQLALVFETLGLPVNARGLSLGAIESGLVEDAQGRFLVVEGDVTNIAGGTARIPPIQVAVKDAAGQTLYSWVTAPPRDSIEPSELVRFRARLATPPDQGRSVQVRFAANAPAASPAGTH